MTKKDRFRGAHLLLVGVIFVAVELLSSSIGPATAWARAETRPTSVHALGVNRSGAFAGTGAENKDVGVLERNAAAGLAGFPDCVQIGRTFREGNYIKGFGSLSSECGGQATLTIQRSRWNGWEDMASATVDGPGYDQYVQYDCTGTGTHTFRTTIEAENAAGHYFFKESNHIRESC